MTPAPYPDLVQMMRAFQESRLLLTAVELDVFTAIGKGATANQAAAALRTDPRATEMLLNALVSLGALTKEGALFRNTTETARHLVSGSVYDARPALLHTVEMWKSWETLTDAVRTGAAVRQPVSSVDDAQRTRSFIAAMHLNAAANAAATVEAVGAAGVERLLDVGGGSGAYSIAFAKANPALQAEIFDRPVVLPIAQRHIDGAGLTARVSTRPGDLTRDDLGTGYDLVLLSAICHMLSPEENQDLFRRCHSALAPGGRLAIRDFILNADKTAPKPAALFSLNMLVNTPAGASYSEDEYRAWLSAAGFATVTRPDPSGDFLVASR